MLKKYRKRFDRYRRIQCTIAASSPANRQNPFFSTLLVVTGLVLMLTGCAAGANPAVDVPAQDGNVAGFFEGLWQGLIVPITFIVSLFTESVSIYEVHNNGGWYDFGFILGASISLGGGGAGAHRASR